MTGDINTFIRNVKTNNLRCSIECSALMEEAERQGISPCKICTLNENPSVCTNIRCVPWATWFLKNGKTSEKWQRLRNKVNRGDRKAV